MHIQTPTPTFTTHAHTPHTTHACKTHTRHTHTCHTHTYAHSYTLYTTHLHPHMHTHTHNTTSTCLSFLEGVTATYIFLNAPSQDSILPGVAGVAVKMYTPKMNHFIRHSKVQQTSCWGERQELSRGDIDSLLWGSQERGGQRGEHCLQRQLWG